MEQKTARLTVLIDPNKKEAFERLCAHLDLTPSQVVRQMIREFLKEHGVEYVPSGASATPPAPPAPEPSRARAASMARAASAKQVRGRRGT